MSFKNADSSYHLLYRPYIVILMVLLSGCENHSSKKEQKINTIDEISMHLPTPPENMVYIPGGHFTMGALPSDSQAWPHEKPAHPVKIDPFFLDKTEVTNAQFEAFVKATGYVTVAERPINWKELQDQLPQGTPKPHDSLLQPGSLVFQQPKTTVHDLQDYSKWWVWKTGANWKHPKGPSSNLEGLDHHPVVHIAYEDALAYCEWAERRLPTEAEWEFAARGMLRKSPFTWEGSQENINDFANSWTGQFPNVNDESDGYVYTAPVGSFPANGYGLFDMAGNVWEWTADWYNVLYYTQSLEQGILDNPIGAEFPFNPGEPYAKHKVIKGGSYLCSDIYCASYRVSARMATAIDSGQEHLGFRTVKDIE